MNSLKTVSKEVKQISMSSCLCPFRYVVLEYSLHHGVLCCMGMFQLLGEGREHVCLPQRPRRKKGMEG